MRAFSKNHSHDLSGRWDHLCFRRSRFTWKNPLFWSSFDLWRIQVVMNPGFISGDDSTQKLLRISLKDSFLIPNLSCKMFIAVPCDMPTVSATLRTFVRRSARIISWTFLSGNTTVNAKKTRFFNNFFWWKERELLFIYWNRKLQIFNKKCYKMAPLETFP